MVSRWERGKRVPGPFWLPHLAAALQVPVKLLERERLKRRTFIGTSLAALAAAPNGDVATDLFSAIAGGDVAPLTQIQTSHHIDLLVSRMTVKDLSATLRLAHWMDNQDSPVARVNACGILAKTMDYDLADQAVCTLERDEAVRDRYLAAVTRRVGSAPSELVGELFNHRDAGARWCGAHLLRDNVEGRQAIAQAIRSEPVRENIRSFAVMLGS
jgi:transcriptional regulator with XRE-family HTH domain